jgi:hypothetical protein
MLCTWPYVLDIDLKALDIGTPSSLASPEFSPRSRRLDFCPRLFCWTRSARQSFNQNITMNGFFTERVHLTNTKYLVFPIFILTTLSNTIIERLFVMNIKTCILRIGIKANPRSAKKRPHFWRQEAVPRISAAVVGRGSVVVVGLEYTLFGLVTCRSTCCKMVWEARLEKKKVLCPCCSSYVSTLC